MLTCQENWSSSFWTHLTYPRPPVASHSTCATGTPRPNSSGDGHELCYYMIHCSSVKVFVKFTCGVHSIVTGVHIFLPVHNSFGTLDKVILGFIKY